MEIRQIRHCTRRPALRSAAAGIVLMAAMAFVITPRVAAQDEPYGEEIVASDITVLVNGDPVFFNAGGPRIRGGRVLIPLRGVIEKMGARVDWDPRRQIMSAVLGENRVRLPIGDRDAYLDDRPVRLDVPAQVVLGRTMVPLRFIAEAFGAEVNWLPSRREVRIATGPATEPPD